MHYCTNSVLFCSWLCRDIAQVWSTLTILFPRKNPIKNLSTAFISHSLTHSWYILPLAIDYLRTVALRIDRAPSQVSVPLLNQAASGTTIYELEWPFQKQHAY